MTSALLHVDVFVFSGAMAGVSLSVIDMLRIANMVAQLQQGASATPVRWQLLNGRGAPSSSANRMFGADVQQPTVSETNPASPPLCFLPPERRTFLITRTSLRLFKAVPKGTAFFISQRKPDVHFRLNQPMNNPVSSPCKRKNE